MCYVPVLKEIVKYNLADKLGIKIDEVNSTLMNLTRGLLYKNEKKAINAHGELACYILDYLLDENQPYMSMLVDTLYKLEIDFENNDKLVNTVGPKILSVIKYLKHSNDKNSSKYLNKIQKKFDPVLQKKESFLKKINEKKVDETDKEIYVTEKELDSTEMDKQQTQGPSTINKEPDMIQVHEDLFTQENVIILSSDNEDDSIEGLQSTKLDEMKRLSEVFKRSLNTTTYDLTSDASD
ncbi:unnamed protein product [Macrosiphum euphorbiae]|nr:unnamed protein product [Macrosiphum euphorbiae]